jgi:hypothetical protein
MNSLLGEKLRYLSDEALAKAIITGTYDRGCSHKKLS